MAESSQYKPKVGLMDLPNELLLKILLELDTYSIHFACVRVNKRFKNLIAVNFHVLDCLNMVGQNDNYVVSNFQSWTRLKKPNIKAVRVLLSPENDDESEENRFQDNILDGLSQLKTLKFMDLFLYSPLHSSNTFQQCWSNLDQLRFLAITYMFQDLYESLGQAKNLKTLLLRTLGFRMADPWCISYEFGDDATEGNHVVVKQTPKTIFNASEFCVDQIGYYDPRVIDPILDIAYALTHFPNLKVLAIRDYLPVTNVETFFDLADSVSRICPLLECLTLFLDFDPTMQYVIHDIPIRNCISMKPETGGAVFANLKQFCISVRCQRTTDCKWFVENLRQVIPAFANGRGTFRYCGDNGETSVDFASADKGAPALIQYPKELTIANPEWAFSEIFGL